MDEVPNTADLIDSVERSKLAKIVEGYTFKYNTTNDLPFKFYAEINIDNSSLWNLFKAIVLHLPEEISLIFNHADEEANYGKYLNKHSVLNTIDKYETELTQDCFLEYGAIHQTTDSLEEIFVDCTKYIKYWGIDEQWFRTIMNEFNLFEIPDLNFIDEFPKVREALRLHKSDTIETAEVIKQLKTVFI